MLQCLVDYPEGQYIDFKLKDKRGHIVVNSQSEEIVLFSLVADLKDVPSSILTTGKNKLKELDPKMAQVKGAYLEAKILGPCRGRISLLLSRLMAKAAK
ncbi:hypothetical protein RQP50_16735 [Paenibacillus sp. chi10]|uniref:Uncharacterized protein n=1 Tax=Paenibacillus suaedae TaxID=3077233 RepID=A0AAJ2JVT4_9BACL|nr:hypothetical protein [Paenibacillus sp. chi10]MDT8977883.1 hypothetical protein [Paenibacillus sp. chi10]